MLWINNSSEPEWLDPNMLSDSAGSTLVWNMFAGLAQVHPQDLEPMPDIARRWDISDDRTVYTFHLRESTWSDGKPLTAHDFEWSWKRLLNPKTAAKYGSMLYVLRNGSAFHQGALWVRGVEWRAGEEDAAMQRIASFFEEVVPVDRVELTDWPEPGAFVYLAGEADSASRVAARRRSRLSTASQRQASATSSRPRTGSCRCRSPTARWSACARSTI